MEEAHSLENQEEGTVQVQRQLTRKPGKAHVTDNLQRQSAVEFLLLGVIIILLCLDLQLI